MAQICSFYFQLVECFLLMFLFFYLLMCFYLDFPSFDWWGCFVSCWYLVVSCCFLSVWFSLFLGLIQGYLFIQYINKETKHHNQPCISYKYSCLFSCWCFFVWCVVFLLSPRFIWLPCGFYSLSDFVSSDSIAGCGTLSVGHACVCWKGTRSWFAAFALTASASSVVPMMGMETFVHLPCKNCLDLVSNVGTKVVCTVGKQK